MKQKNTKIASRRGSSTGLMKRLSRTQLMVMAAAIVVVVGGGGAYWIASSHASGPPCIDQGVFGQGSSGRCVQIIQDVTLNAGYYQGSGYFRYGSRASMVNGAYYQDGIFGPITAGQVKNFQAFEHIAVDGLVGRQTWGKMCGLTYMPKADHYTACGY